MAPPRRAPILTVVVPCYNEQEVLPETIRRLGELLDGMLAESLIAPGSFFLLVDDGSTDHTWRLIEEAHDRDPRVAGLKLAHNAGHQRALLAGLHAVPDTVDCAISVDADLQDDLGVMRDFILAYRAGNEIVFGVRRERSVDTRFKRWSALGFYRVMRRMGVDLVYNHADYRLMSRKALGYLGQFGEVNLFLRGVVKLIGLPSATVTYDRQERFAGESKYPLRKMLAFAFDGITSFSVTPMRWVTYTGIAFVFFSGAAGLYGLISLAAGVAEPGWTSLILSVWFIGGVQLVSLGLFGEYLGKIYQETKGRPRYFIETELPARVGSGPESAGPD
ncbi:MAG: glycosyltransferase family 2 protein [Thermoleophilia bacterium]